MRLFSLITGLYGWMDGDQQHFPKHLPKQNNNSFFFFVQEWVSIGWATLCLWRVAWVWEWSLTWRIPSTWRWPPSTWQPLGGSVESTTTTLMVSETRVKHQLTHPMITSGTGRVVMDKCVKHRTFTINSLILYYPRLSYNFQFANNNSWLTMSTRSRIPGLKYCLSPPL